MTMRTTNSRRALAACAVGAGLLLTGCASTANLGGSAGSPTGSPSSATAVPDDGLKLPTAIPSYTGKDPACKSAANAVGDLGPSLGSMTNETDAADTFSTLAQQAHSAASLSSSQDVVTAVSSLGDDYQAISDALHNGSTPDFVKMTRDAVAVVKACADAG